MTRAPSQILQRTEYYEAQILFTEDLHLIVETRLNPAEISIRILMTS